jgi:hypothetical protein
MTAMTLTRTFITYEQLEAHVAFDDDIKEGVCAYCDAQVSTNQIDHIYSVIQKGGKPSLHITESPLNKVPCCQSCNSSKSNEEVLHWMTNKKMCSKEQIERIKRRMTKVPKWDDQTYQSITFKRDIFNSIHMIIREFCESKVTNVNDLQKELNDILTKLQSHDDT